MIEAMENYKKYGDKINKEIYIDDMLRTLVSFGFRQVGEKPFLAKVEAFFQDNMHYLKSKMAENLVFFLTRLNSQNENLITSLLNYI